MRAVRLTGRAALVFALCLLCGCVLPPQTRELTREPPPGLAPSAALEDTPFFAQDAYQCGPAALAMVLARTGVAVTPEDLVPEVYVPARKGSFQVEMLAAARRNGRLALQVQPGMDSLLHWVDSGEPVLVLQNLGLEWYPMWHYSVVIGYDLDAREMLLHSGEIANYRVAMGTFERTWARSGYWGMVTLAPGELPYAEDEGTYFRAAAALEETAPGVDTAPAWAAGEQAWPRSPDMAMGMANLLYARGEYEAAMQAYAALVADFPGYLAGYNNLASLQTELGRPAAAIATATAGLEQAGGSNPMLEATLAEARAKLAATDSAASKSVAPE